MRMALIALGIGLIIALSIGLFAILLPRLISHTLRASAPYRIATGAAAKSPTAIQALGQPMKFGEAAGTVTGSPPFGFTHLTIPVDGAKTSGVIYVTGRLRFRWKFSRLELEVPGGPTIDLRSPAEIA